MNKKKLCVASMLLLLFAANLIAFAEGNGPIPPKAPLDYKLDDYRNYFGVWCGGARDSLRYARNMGMRHVIYQSGMEKCPEAAGMKFYYVDPEYITYKRTIDFGKKYTQKDIDEWREVCAMKDASLPFPDCMATGWFWRFNSVKKKSEDPEYNVCSLIPNLQRQKVIDMIVAKIISRVSDLQKRNPNFKFAGFVWDVPQLEGDFWGFDKKGRPRQVGMSFWRGVDSVSVPEGVKLDYPTYCEGRVAFYRQLRAAAKKVNPDVKLIMDPAVIYGHYVKDFVRLGIKPGDPALADFVQLEFGTDDYLKDKKAWESGYLKVENLANAVDYYCYNFEKEIHAVGAAAAVGAWSLWFGNPCPTLPSIRDVPARMKLSRSIATWENLNNTPIEKREWNLDKKEYSSPTAYMSNKLLWAIHPETKKMFFCFTSADGELSIPEGMEIEEIFPLTSIFDEYRKPKVMKNFKIKDGKLSLAENSHYLVGEAFSAKLKKSGPKDKGIPKK